MNKTLLSPLLVIAAIGFVVSLVAHVVSVAGIQLPGGDAIFGLHAGVFVVWVPTVIMLNKAGFRGAGRDGWKLALRGCPTWMQRALVGLLVYAIVNFVIFFVSGPRSHSSHGGAAPAVVRGFSGHWLAFYGIGFGVIYSAIRRPDLLRPKLCSQGHATWADAAFCPQCGKPFKHDLDAKSESTHSNDA